MYELVDEYLELDMQMKKLLQKHGGQVSPEADEIMDRMDEIMDRMDEILCRMSHDDRNEAKRRCDPVVPQITDERLDTLLARIKPVHRFGDLFGGDALYYIKPVDPRRIAFLWDPKKGRKAIGLVELRRIRTHHNYGHPSLFKPSIAEVLAQIPEDIVDSVVAFETLRGADLDEVLECHVAMTILYGKKQ